MLDADERHQARELVAGVSDRLSPVSALEIVQTPRRQWVNPYTALLDEITRTQAFVVLLEVEVAGLDAAGGAHRAGRAGTNLLMRFDRERDRLINACKTAISLGIAERQVRLAEQQGELMSRAAISAVNRTEGLSSDQRRELLVNLAHELRAIELRELSA